MTYLVATAHWLAIEGVQPLIKENPSPAGQSAEPRRRPLADPCRLTELAKFAQKAHTSNLNTTDASGSTITPLVKHVLSRELQLYFTRLTEALGSAGAGASTELRDAALGSVRSDPGLHQLVPYLVGWGGEQVRCLGPSLFGGLITFEQIANHLDDLSALERALDLFHAMLENPTLFIEPYVSGFSLALFLVADSCAPQ